MGYDKLIDSARLDAAMTATADAIREKTNYLGKIAWDADKGFADKIASFKKYYVDSFMFHSEERKDGEDFSVGVFGLGFRPSALIIYASDPPPDGWLNSSTLLCIEYDGGKTICYRAYAVLDSSGYPRMVLRKADGAAHGINIEVYDNGFYIRIGAEYVNNAIEFERGYTFCAFE